MIFPLPKNPDDWQTAYPRKQAYYDSEKRSSAFLTSLVFGVPVVIFAFIRILYLRFYGTYPGWGWDILNVLLISTLIAGVLAGAFRFAASFFSKFYLTPENIDPLKIINFRLFGIQKPMSPLETLSQSKYIIAKDGNLEKKDEWPCWMARNLGGPLLLVIFDGCALYLERGNRFSRVVGPGDQLPFLEQYETIKYVVDLRPKVKTGDITVWTKDGIRITLSIKITCGIGDPAKKDPAGKLVYPYDPVAVKKAIERYAIRWPKDQKEPSEFTWLHAAWGQVTGIVPGFIGSRSLDDLLIADRQSGQILSPGAIQTIFQALNQATNQFGVYITDFQVIKMEPPEKVKEEHKNIWGAERQSIATIIDGRAKADSIRTSEEARAEAQRNLILAIAEGLEKNPSKQFDESLLLSLSTILDESLEDPLARSYLAKESLDTLEKLQKLLDTPTQ
jgi:regulator of protease activity HflC (stomatin/prohibitin superfamily)